MANARTGNVFYVDATGAYEKRVAILSVTITTNAASAELIISDPNTSAIILSLKEPTSDVTTKFSFADDPIICTNGADVTTITNCVASIVMRDI